MSDEVTAAIFVAIDQDALIWGEKETGDAIYLHRIVTNPLFRGKNLLQAIIFWARSYAVATGKKYVRMDTWGNNPKLIDLLL